jgi:hypothetical protein
VAESDRVDHSRSKQPVPTARKTVAPAQQGTDEPSSDDGIEFIGSMPPPTPAASTRPSSSVN